MQSQKPSWRKARSWPSAASAAQRLALEHAVLAEVVERARLEAEEAAVDPVLAARLLDEAGDPVAVELGDAPLQVRPDHGHRRQPAVRAVELEQRAEVDVGDAVGVGQRRRSPPEPLGEARRPAPRSACRARCRRTRPRPPPASARPRRTPPPPRPGSRWRAGSARTPAPRRSAITCQRIGRAADLDQRLRHRLGPLPQPRPAPAAEDDDRRLSHRRRLVDPAPAALELSDSRPAATAGRIVTSSPSLIAVSRPCWKRMSSPET